MTIEEFLKELKTIPDAIIEINQKILDHEKNIAYNIEYYRYKISVLEEKYDIFTGLKQMDVINPLVYSKIESDLILMIHYMQEILKFLEKAAYHLGTNKLSLYNQDMDLCVHYMNLSSPLFVRSYLKNFNINDIVMPNSNISMSDSTKQK